MKRKYFLNKVLRTAKFARLMAKVIDLFIVFILSVSIYPVGVLFSLFYIGICDSLQNGQSVGKRFMGFTVISLEDGKPCSIKQSVVRNMPIMVPLFFAIIPIWGVIISVLLGLPLIILELYLILKLDSGHRLGDVMADTSVVAQGDNKVLTSKHQSSWFPEEGQPT
jgi:uncharacterized RDD family membrane protein YckC